MIDSNSNWFLFNFLFQALSWLIWAAITSNATPVERSGPVRKGRNGFLRRERQALLDRRRQLFGRRQTSNLKDYSKEGEDIEAITDLDLPIDGPTVLEPPSNREGKETLAFGDKTKVGSLCQSV